MIELYDTLKVDLTKFRDMMAIYDNEDMKTWLASYVTDLKKDENAAIVEATCDAFIKLLLSITPFKAREYVEKNCAKVKHKIMSTVKEKN